MVPAAGAPDAPDPALGDRATQPTATRSVTIFLARLGRLRPAGAGGRAGPARPARRRPRAARRGPRAPPVGRPARRPQARQRRTPRRRTGRRFIDWQMTLQAPVAVELGWFLVTNSGELPIPPDDVLARYRTSIGWYAGRWGSGTKPHDLEGLVGDWALQRDLAVDRRAAAARLAEGPRRRGRGDARVGRPRPPTTWRGGVPARSRRRSAACSDRSGGRGEVAPREDHQRGDDRDRDDGGEDDEVRRVRQARPGSALAST